MSMPDFYRKQKNIVISNTNQPGVRGEQSKDAIYPIQVLKVIPFQRIPLEKMSEEISSNLLRVCLILCQTILIYT
jgi:hypothetical protein